MSEASAWESIRGQLSLRGAHVQRFTDKLFKGIPDTNCCTKKGEIWLEGKYIDYPPTRSIQIPLKIEQANWLESRQKAGGNCFVWVRVGRLYWVLIRSDFRGWRKGKPVSEWNALERFSTVAELVAKLPI